jgi:hypothetical protein
MGVLNEKKCKKYLISGISNKSFDNSIPQNTFNKDLLYKKYKYNNINTIININTILTILNKLYLFLFNNFIYIIFIL